MDICKEIQSRFYLEGRKRKALTYLKNDANGVQSECISLKGASCEALGLVEVQCRLNIVCNIQPCL
jgi:hypothetical protein